MTTTLDTGALVGIQGIPITVTVCAKHGRTRFDWSGASETAAREGKVRVSHALKACGISFERSSIDVHVEPAANPCDLAVAAALLVELGVCPAASFDDMLPLANLSLAGKLQPVRGILAIVTSLRPETTLVAPGSAEETDLAPDHIVTASTLQHVIDGNLEAVEPKPWSPDPWDARAALVQVPRTVGRSLELAAAGGHGLLLVGVPGSGTVTTAERSPSSCHRSSLTKPSKRASSTRPPAFSEADFAAVRSELLITRSAKPVSSAADRKLGRERSASPTTASCCSMRRRSFGSVRSKP